MHSFVEGINQSRRNHPNQENNFSEPRLPPSISHLGSLEILLSSMPDSQLREERQSALTQVRRERQEYTRSVDKRALGDITEQVLRKRESQENMQLSL